MAQKKEIEADVPKAMSNDYECLGFDNPTFSTFQASDGTDATAELGGGDEEKVNLADDSL